MGMCSSGSYSARASAQLIAHATHATRYLPPSSSPTLPTLGTPHPWQLGPEAIEAIGTHGSDSLRVLRVEDCDQLPPESLAPIARWPLSPGPSLMPCARTCHVHVHGMHILTSRGHSSPQTRRAAHAFLIGGVPPQRANSRPARRWLLCPPLLSLSSWLLVTIRRRDRHRRAHLRRAA